ncbi:MAG: hypothetical protein M5U26_25995 [Planctomycetota bacterium]|nr:hypothetical protein [Planctomycetota bacterium]
MRHRQELTLEFKTGNLRGDGYDGVGAFLIRGRYDRESREVWWTKQYLLAHAVDYRGFREGRGIWGTWEIRGQVRGGFRIWPKALGETEGEYDAAEIEAPADALAIAAAAPGVLR